MKGKRMKKWSIYALALFLPACASEEVPEPDRHPARDSGELTIRISFPENRSTTRALSASDEKKITSLRVFIFSDAGSPGISRDDKFVEMIDATTILEGTDTDREVTVTVKKPSGGDPDQRFVLVANMHNDLNINLSSLVENVSTEGDLINLLRFSTTAKWGAAPAEGDQTKYIPMWGTSGFYDQSGFETASPISVNMTRALAGIEIGIDINNPAAGDPALGFGHIFVVDSVYVCNVNDSAYIAPAAWKDNISSKKADVGYKFPANGLMLERSIYVSPTDSLIIASGDTTHLPPFLILKAQYYGGDSYYYRIDFTKDNSYTPLLRDNKYIVNITGIRTTGYKTFNQARNAPVLPLNPNLILDGADPATRNINDIVYLDQYWLGCRSTDVRIDCMAKNALMGVATSYPGGWTARVTSSSPDFLDDSRLVCADNDLLIKPVNGINATGTILRATIELSAGTLKQHVNVTQSPGSNTYIAQVGINSCAFPVESANIDGIDRASSITSVSVLRSTGVSNPDITYTGSLVSVSNLLSTGVISVAAFDVNNEHVWTWTVWVVDNVNFESQTNQRHYNGYTFMDRNLGEGSYFDVGGVYRGLYYQWGRKDPVDFMGNAANTTAAIDEIEVLKRPSTFYNSPTYPYDWMGAGQKNNLWTTIKGEKAPYDPCPFGWRVPPAENNEASPWDGFINGSNGISLSPGGITISYQTTDDDQAAVVWGASARGTDAYAYYLPNHNNGTLGEHRKVNRASACQIRCVRDVKYPGGSLIVK
ncbi:MAG: hypothetical protein LBI58_01920 [Tannerellaceae bacterium]|jgi:hypothetical protein|nr:hypothetical protein [Tannerellaceae bacterium]